MINLKTAPPEMLINERDMAIRNLQANCEYMSQDMIERTQEYLLDIVTELQERGIG